MITGPPDHSNRFLVDFCFLSTRPYPARSQESFILSSDNNSPVTAHLLLICDFLLPCLSSSCLLRCFNHNQTFVYNSVQSREKNSIKACPNLLGLKRLSLSVSCSKLMFLRVSHATQGSQGLFDKHKVQTNLFRKPCQQCRDCKSFTPVRICLSEAEG
jgi:hypothetical protein